LCVDLARGEGIFDRIDDQLGNNQPKADGPGGIDCPLVAHNLYRDRLLFSDHGRSERSTKLGHIGSDIDPLDPLSVDEGAPLASNINQKKAFVFANDLGMLPRNSIVEQLKIVLRLAANRKDGLVERNYTLTTKTCRDF
jgi:hypothetical protein